MINMPQRSNAPRQECVVGLAAVSCEGNYCSYYANSSHVYLSLRSNSLVAVTTMVVGVSVVVGVRRAITMLMGVAVIMVVVVPMIVSMSVSVIVAQSERQANASKMVGRGEMRVRRKSTNCTTERK